MNEKHKLTVEQQEYLDSVLGKYDLCFVGIHGSRLYGLDHDKSDHDIKAIYLPSKTDLILGNAVKTVSKKNDDLNIEIEIKSLSSFLKSAENCDTNCVDLLHTPEDMILYKNSLWDFIADKRHNLYAKNMKGLVGYVRTHVHKYSNKIERLKEMQQLREMIIYNEDGYYDSTTIKRFTENHIEVISQMKYINPVTLVQDHEQQYLEVCGKKYIFTWVVGQLLNALDNEISRYGKRTSEGLQSGLDTKALSHSLRVLYQMREMIDTGDLVFPLKDAEHIKAVKMGEITDLDVVMDEIDSLYEEVMEKLENSGLPDEVDLSEMYEVVKSYYFK